MPPRNPVPPHNPHVPEPLNPRVAAIPIPPPIMATPAVKYEKIEALAADGNNYHAWADVIEVILDQKDVLDAIDPDKMPKDDWTDAERSEWSRKNKIARGQMMVNIDFGVLNQLDKTNAVTLWSSIRKRYTRTSDQAQSVADARLRVKKNPIG